MTNVLAKVILDIEKMVTEHLRLGQPQNVVQIMDQILAIMAKAPAVEIAERVKGRAAIGKMKKAASG